jgi:DNA-binding beta-propeller fold protein YncE
MPGRNLIVLVMMLLAANVSSVAAQSFVNWESPHVSGLDMIPNGNVLLAVNTPDNRLEVFDLSSGTAVWSASIAVGLDPVSVRAFDDTTAWIVNHISDSISIVDLAAGNVQHTIRTLDEPADVVFAGDPLRAFVSCSQANTVMVFDPVDPALVPIEILIDGEDPRALAVSPDGMTVYAAVFESGNATTILGGGLTIGGGFPPNVVSHPLGPYGGTNPPPNDGAAFEPSQNAGNPAPPAVGLIVRRNDAGVWLDDNNSDWTDLVSGANADLSGRPVGWDLFDYDLAMIDTATLAVDYVSGLMNTCSAVGVMPNGTIAVVGLEATNEIRFEPVVNGTFVRSHIALVDPTGLNAPTIEDLNTHLDYTASMVAQPLRDLSLGDPRGVAWTAAGDRGYVTGFGSNNVVVVDSSAIRMGVPASIEVGEGPTSIVLDEARDQLYVLNKFSASISVVDLTSHAVLDHQVFFDPSPDAITIGRKHLYDTHKNSGLGQASCASCHIDARTDRLAWDLGDPAGSMKAFNQNCNAGLPIGGACEDWHPMKGPMATQTLQDIIGKEPLHWRGDRDGLEEFNAAFMGLLGDDTNLMASEMQEFKDFVATIHFPPNPFRNFDNSLPSNLPLPGHFTTGRFAPAGQPLPNGNAVSGLNRYRTGTLDGGIDCVSCHTLPTGIGTNFEFVGVSAQSIPPGPNGELHHTVVSTDGSTNISIKVPQLRNVYEKVGFETTQLSNRAGFGYLHDGSIDSVARFLSEPVFDVVSDQDVANLVAFMLAFSGSDLPTGSSGDPFELPGPASLDTHAAVGWQTTLVDSGTADPDQLQLIADMIAEADSGAVGLVVRGLQDGAARGYTYIGAGQFQADRNMEMVSAAILEGAAASGSELTYTVVPAGSQIRIGIDRDEDGHLDRDEVDACSNPADATSIPTACGCGCQLYADVHPPGPSPGDCLVDLQDIVCVADAFVDVGLCPGADVHPCVPDGSVNLDDILAALDSFAGHPVCDAPCPP